MNKLDNEDSFYGRWRYFPKVWIFLWNLSSRNVIYLLAILSIAGCLPVFNIYLLQIMVDSAVGVIRGATSLTHAFIGLAIFLIVTVFHNLFEMFYQRIGSNIREQMKMKAQQQLLCKAGRLSLDKFETAATFDQLHRAQKGVENSLLGTLDHLFSIVMHFFTAAGLLIYIGSTHFMFPLLLIVGVIVLQLVQARFNRVKYRLDKKHTPSERNLLYLSRLLAERQSAAEIRLYGLQNYLFKKREKLFHQMKQDRLELAVHGLRLRLFPSMLEQFMYVLVITGVVAMIAVGKLSIGHYAAFIGAAERFRDSTMLSFGGFIVLDHDLRYIRDLLDYLQMQEESSQEDTKELDAKGVRSFSENRIPTIRFESVSFQYPGSPEPILDDISFTVHPGEKMALVGLNGAGKSTLAKILLGLYQPSSGRITIDGQDLNEIDQVWWRSKTAAVFQDYMKYHLTVRENIGFGNLEMMTNEERIQNAARKGGADQLIQSLPGGYNTFLGKQFDEKGEDLSIGQWQKLAVSRAYIKDASILVLDEPTSALDAKAEVEVYTHFQNMAENRSVLFISHRLGYAKLTDRILVLESGKIVEEGSHHQLIRDKGKYNQLYQSQAQWYR